MLKIKFAFLFFVVIFAFGTNIFAQTPKPTPPESVEKVATEEIKLNVLALTKDGDFAAKLAPEDLVINEDGRLNQANSVRRIPANVLLVLDVGGEIAYAKRNKITAETARALVAALQPNDSVAAMQYGDKVEMLSGWTKDKNQLAQVLSDRKLDFGKRSVFNEAVQKAIEFFNKTPLENRHLILVTDGVDSFDNAQAKNNFTKNLLSSDINVHVVSYTKLQQQAIGTTKTVTASGTNNSPSSNFPPGIGLPHKNETQTFPVATVNLDREMIRKRKEEMNKLQTSEKFLTRIAEDTNGEIFLPETPDEMIAKTATLAKNIDSQYVVTYTPKRPLSEARDGEIRTIEVTSRRAGLEVQGRRKFVVANNK